MQSDRLDPTEREDDDIKPGCRNLLPILDLDNTSVTVFTNFVVVNLDLSKFTTTSRITTMKRTWIGVRQQL